MVLAGGAKYPSLDCPWISSEHTACTKKSSKWGTPEPPRRHLEGMEWVSKYPPGTQRNKADAERCPHRQKRQDLDPELRVPISGFRKGVGVGCSTLVWMKILKPGAPRLHDFRICSALVCMKILPGAPPGAAVLPPTLFSMNPTIGTPWLVPAARFPEVRGGTVISGFQKFRAHQGTTVLPPDLAPPTLA